MKMMPITIICDWWCRWWWCKDKHFISMMMWLIDVLLLDFFAVKLLRWKHYFSMKYRDDDCGDISRWLMLMPPMMYRCTISLADISMCCKYFISAVADVIFWWVFMIGCKDEPMMMTFRCRWLRQMMYDWCWCSRWWGRFHLRREMSH